MNVLSLRSQVSSRRRVLIWITLLALGLGVLGSPLPADGSILPYTMQVLSIEGAQGDILPAHLYVPTGPVPEEGFPAVVFIHSWAMNQLEYETKMFQFAADGYVTISYTCRGWYGADGQVETAGPLEMEDLNKVVDTLISSAPVNPDKIGATGISYGGGQSLLALQFEPRIKTAVSMSGWTDFNDALTPNDSLKLVWDAFLIGSAALLADESDIMGDWLVSFLTDTDVDETKASLAVRSPATYLDEINSRGEIPPIFIIQGINDDLFTSGQIVDFYEDYQGEKKLQLANGIHATAEFPGLMLLPNSIWDDTKDWFDYWLKGAENGIMDEPPVSIYQSWTRSQKSFSDYPVPESTDLVLYPAKGILKGQLNKTKGSRGQSTTLENDPFSLSTSGVPIVSPLVESYLGVSVVDPTPLSVLLDEGATYFESDMLLRPVTVMGQPHITFLVQPDNDSFQLNFLVYDVNLVGTASLVGHIPYTIKHAAAGQPYEVDVDMNLMAHKFAAGHKIRLVVSTADMAYVVPVLDDYSIDLLYGGDYDSRLELPVLP